MCVVIGRWPDGRCVLLFACVVTCLHINVVGFSFKKNLLVSLHFPPTIFLFFFVCYLQNSFRFSLAVLLFVFRSGGSARGAALFCCCSVVSFVLSFRIVINAILHQLLLLFLAVPPPILHHFVVLKCTCRWQFCCLCFALAVLFVGLRFFFCSVVSFHYNGVFLS